MKILIIAPLSSQSSKGDKIVPLEVTNWSNSAVEIESRYSFLAEKELLEDEKHEVKILSLVPTKIRNELDITSNDYRDLVNKIRESLKINNDDNMLLEVIPYEDTISFGTSLFFSYLNIYNVIKTFSPNLILLDISYSDSSFSTLISKASEIAMTDLLFTQQVDNYIYAVVSKRDNGYIQPISNIVKNKRNTSLTEYLLREMKIMKSEKQIELPQIIGRAELRRFGFCIENCYPLVALHILDGINLEKLLSEEEILKIVIENMEFNNGKIMANVELFEGATYYVLATHLVKKYRCNKPFSIDNLRDILSLMSSVCNRLSNQLIDELIISLNYLLKYLELKEKEYRLIDIYDLIKLPLNVFVRKEKIVSEILNSYRGDCDNIDLNGIGLDPNATVIKIDSDKVRIYYAEECEDKVLNRLKDLMGD